MKKVACIVLSGIARDRDVWDTVRGESELLDEFIEKCKWSEMGRK